MKSNVKLKINSLQSLENPP
uniref:Uncharacterized protein n=1 Tax=Anguilla anguilla TaxID=7936 RepID=A0A0E9T4L9_ANGAN